jgi:hypothetical protein
MLSLILLWVLSAAVAYGLSRCTSSLTSTPLCPSSESDPSVTEALLARAEIPSLDPYDLSQRLYQGAGSCELPASFAAPSVSAVCAEDEATPLPQYTVGDRETFWVLQLDSATSLAVGATLQHVGQRLYMWAQDGIELDPQAAERSAAVFDEDLYPTIRRYFGSEWSPGIDLDERLHVLHTRFGGAVGYFSSHNEYPRTVIPDSNEREMFYVNADRAQPGTTSYDSTLAHEFQHMVHWFADHNEDAWVNEGASELAMQLCGYSRQSRIGAFARNPDIPLTHWERERVSEHYAAAHLLLTYFVERHGAEALQDLVASPLNGIEAFDALLSARDARLSFDHLFADWLIANYLDNRASLSRTSPYAYQQLDVHVEPDHVVFSYPTQAQGEVHQYAADYVELAAAGQDLQLTFSGAATTTLVPNQPHSGRYQWWSNRGDNSDMTLTRQFDLTGLTEATLHVWLWYDIEDGWDYAYVEVSTDGGARWHILPGMHTRGGRPGGNARGPGYTGISGREEGSPARARWLEERFDLSSYAGQPVLVRFEYVTDEAVNRPGLCIDDVSIPEIGYYHDAEGGDDGWAAQGFVRCDSIVPQRYILQLLRIPAQPAGAALRCPPLGSSQTDADCAVASRDRITVQQLCLEEDQQGVWLLSAGDAASKTALAISATSLARGVTAPYEYQIHPAE